MRKVTISSIALLSTALILGGGAYYCKNKDNAPKKAISYTLTHEINGLNQAIISASLLVNETFSSEKTLSPKENDNMPIMVINAPIQFYKMTYRIEKENFDIIDIGLSQKGNDLFFIAEGLTPKEPISIQSNNKILHDKVPTDWAGKLELHAFIVSDRNVCIAFNNKETICHRFEKEGSISS